jgi:hypothetical protein
MQNEIDILKDVSEKLRSAGIAFMLTGSVAMSYYATPRMTRDIDIVVALDRDDIEKTSSLFESDYYVSQEAVADAIRRKSMFNIIHFESVIKVDLIVLRNTPFAITAFGRRRELAVGDFQTTIISREDLILSKLVWAKDSGSEMQLRDVRNLLAAVCDIDYLRKWAEDLSVKETLESLLNSHE